MVYLWPRRRTHPTLLQLGCFGLYLRIRIRSLIGSWSIFHVHTSGICFRAGNDCDWNGRASKISVPAGASVLLGTEAFFGAVSLLSALTATAFPIDKSEAWRKHSR